MKKILFILLTIFIFGNPLYAQDTYRNEVTWLGLDFTQAQLANRSAFTNSRVIRDSYLLKWNNIIFNEPKKYNIAKYLDIRNLSSDITHVNERNSKIKHQELVVNQIDNNFKFEDIEKTISEYPKAEGIGLVFIVESFDKVTATGTYWVCFFNRANSEILATKRIKGRAKGIGIRNYWANSLYTAMKRF